jgi:hypothetical protein
MATFDLLLEKYPEDARARELWLQHAAGLILFEDARQYAIDRIDKTLNDEERQRIIKGIDDAIYGFMMILDGVTGQLRGPNYSVTLETKAVLSVFDRNASRMIIDQVDLKRGDGMCMGYAGWLEGDFGNYLIASRKVK